MKRYKRHTPEPGAARRIEYGVPVLADCRRCGLPVYRNLRRGTHTPRPWQHQLGASGQTR